MIKYYDIHSLKSNESFIYGCESPYQALLLCDFHENKESILKVLPAYVKNNDLLQIMQNHKFYHGAHSLGFGNYCIANN